MKNKKSVLIGMAVLACFALLTPRVFSEPEGEDQEENAQCGPGERMQAKCGELYKELGLSGEQKKMLDENKAKNKDAMKETFSQMKEKRELMKEELQKEEINTAKVTEINNELKALQSKMQDAKLSSILEVRQILTPEQFKKFSEKVDKRKGDFRKKEGRFGKKGMNDVGEEAREKQHEEKTKLLNEAAEALQATRPDLAEGLREMAAKKNMRNRGSHCE